MRTARRIACSGWMRWRGSAGLVALTVLGATGLSMGAGSAWAAVKPPAVVSIGDSYISGEAGRWKGNSLDIDGDRDGTDRAYVNGIRDEHVVYGTSYDNGCDRSDSAEIKSAQFPFGVVPFNLACSGAETINVISTKKGGVSFKGEVPQNDALRKLVKEVNVQLIVVNVGGNDLGFSAS